MLILFDFAIPERYHYSARSIAVRAEQYGQYVRQLTKQVKVRSLSAVPIARSQLQQQLVASFSFALCFISAGASRVDELTSLKGSECALFDLLIALYSA